MGERARRLYLDRTTPSERLDAGLRMADEFVQARVRELDLPDDLSQEERASRIFQALRALGS